MYWYDGKKVHMRRGSRVHETREGRRKETVALKALLPAGCAQVCVD